MSQINFTRKTFLEKEEIARLQEFLRDSPSENAIIGNTSKYGILRTDFQNDTDFLVEPSSNAGRVKIAKQENKAVTIDGNRIYQEAIDNIEVPDDNLWYWMRIKYKYVTYEKGTVSINTSGDVVGSGTSFLEVLRGQGTQVPTKVKFLKLDGTPAINSGFYEVVDVLNNQNLILTSAVDFVAENDLRLVVLGTTPLGEMLSAEQQEGLYKYDSCEIEFIPEDVEDSETPPHLSMSNPDTTYEEDKMFYIARVKNSAGFVEVDNNNTHVRADFWEFNVVGLTDKLSKFSNLSDLSNVNAALSNLGITTAGRNITRVNPETSPSYIQLLPNGTTEVRPISDVADDLEGSLGGYFLRKWDNLSDLTDKPAARENLDVYSKGEVYSKEYVDDLEDSLGEKLSLKNEYQVLSLAPAYSFPEEGKIIFARSLRTVTLEIDIIATSIRGMILDNGEIPETYRPTLNSRDNNFVFRRDTGSLVTVPARIEVRQNGSLYLIDIPVSSGQLPSRIRGTITYIV